MKVVTYMIIDMVMESSSTMMEQCIVENGRKVNSLALDA